MFTCSDSSNGKCENFKTSKENPQHCINYDTIVENGRDCIHFKKKKELPKPCKICEETDVEYQNISIQFKFIDKDTGEILNLCEKHELHAIRKLLPKLKMREAKMIPCGINWASDNYVVGKNEIAII
jgi:hypothetical protein